MWVGCSSHCVVLVSFNVEGRMAGQPKPRLTQTQSGNGDFVLVRGNSARQTRPHFGFFIGRDREGRSSSSFAAPASSEIQIQIFKSVKSLVKSLKIKSLFKFVFKFAFQFLWASLSSCFALLRSRAS